MRNLVIWTLIWSSIVVAVLLNVPGSTQSEGCWRTVGGGASPECLAELAAVNDRIWWTRTLPMLLFLSSGYFVIAMVALRRRVHRPSG